MTSATDFLGSAGPIARRLAGYEPRREQLEMAAAIEAAIAGQKKLVVEAGTGVGKSFGYLVPSLLAATTGDTPLKVVVSTHTISLQEQLIQKDVPLLRSVWPNEFSAVLVKGRSNYISRRRAKVAAEKSAGTLLPGQATDQVDVLLEWSQKSPEGSLSELGFKPLPMVWDQVRSEHGNCLGKRCPEYEKCHYFAARRRLRNANLLVVNHSLFFADLALRQDEASILPDYDVVIFDEAHTLEEVAAGHFGLDVANTTLDYQLNKLFNPQTQKGLLVAFGENRLYTQVVACKLEAETFFNAVDRWAGDAKGGNGRVRKKNAFANRIGEPVKVLALEILERCKDVKEETGRIELQAAAARLLDVAADVRDWLEQTDDESVYWVERQGRRVALASSPVELADRLKSQLWDKLPTAVVTSATLSLNGGGDFSYFTRRLGLAKPSTLAVGSPFDYPKQAKLHLMRNMPDPSAEPAAFEEACFATIPMFLEMTAGHAFVLFTSHRLLKQAADRLSPWCHERGWPVFSQSDGTPRNTMLEQFRQTPNAVLLGTDSFWQGVDVQGDALQMVIITRLPFSVPDRPVTEARLEAIAKRGGNAFAEYSLPEAIIKLKQGFGRLIRTNRDRGHVAILDPRIKTKPYGARFLAALPKMPIEEHAYKRPQQEPRMK